MKRAAAAVGIFLLNVLLNSPIWMSGEFPFRGSIEGGYASMARFVWAHPNPWGWNPFWYCGLPTQFMYVPLIPYSAAGLAHLVQISPDYAHRLITAFATCFQPVAVFLFVLYFLGRERWKWALAISIVYSLFSPAYGLFPQIEKDRGIAQLPWRIQVLAKYGEGPHGFGLALLPLALIAVWRAGTRNRIFLASIVLALIPLANWLSAFSLAIACVLLLFAAWGEPGFRIGPPLAAAGLAYLLAAFWMTPSFIRVIAFNWPADSFGYTFHVKQAYLLIGMIAGIILIRFVARRATAYFRFVLIAAFAFGWIATTYYIYGIDTVPESRRYALEFELFLILALGEGLRLALGSKDSTVRLCAIGSAGVMLLVGLPQLWAYVTQPRSLWKPVPAETTIEKKLADWLNSQHPQGRVFASGGLRFRLNSWYELPQVGGGFETGLRNRKPLDLAFRVRTGKSFEPELSELGVEFLVVHGPQSREYYRDFHGFAPFSPIFQLENDQIYRLPPPSGAKWLDTTHVVVDGPKTSINADPGWEAPIPLATDENGFIRVQGPVELHYRGTAEQRVFAGVSLAAWLSMMVVWLRSRRSGSTRTS